MSSITSGSLLCFASSRSSITKRTSLSDEPRSLLPKSSKMLPIGSLSSSFAPPPPALRRRMIDGASSSEDAGSSSSTELSSSPSSICRSGSDEGCKRRPSSSTSSSLNLKVPRSEKPRMSPRLRRRFSSSLGMPSISAASSMLRYFLAIIHRPQ